MMFSWINEQPEIYNSFEMYAVTIKISMTECHINKLYRSYGLF